MSAAAAVDLSRVCNQAFPGAARARVAPPARWLGFPLSGFTRELAPIGPVGPVLLARLLFNRLNRPPVR